MTKRERGIDNMLGTRDKGNLSTGANHLGVPCVSGNGEPK
jgi:hypothetical protein